MLFSNLCVKIIKICRLPRDHEVLGLIGALVSMMYYYIQYLNRMSACLTHFYDIRVVRYVIFLLEANRGGQLTYFHSRIQTLSGPGWERVIQRNFEITEKLT